MTSFSTPQPNAVVVAWSILRSLITVSTPRPGGTGKVDHSLFGRLLADLDGDVARRLPAVEGELASYLMEMEQVTPDDLTPAGALAYWMNVYNAAALRLGAETARSGLATVLGIPGAFTKPVVSVAGEGLSLDAIEHAKIRRFKDPRVHAGLVCGSVSCPTLRREPFGGDVAHQLDDQMRRFLAEGAFGVDESAGRVVLSPIFSWFGRDFVRPDRMPTLLPARRDSVVAALARWMPEEVTSWLARAKPDVTFGSYDWRLGCAIG
jgi:hypothetical protein